MPGRTERMDLQLCLEGYWKWRSTRYERSGKCGFEQVRWDYEAVGVRDKHELAPAVMFDDWLNFMDHDVLLKRRISYARAYGHNFESGHLTPVLFLSPFPAIFESRRKFVYGYNPIPTPCMNSTASWVSDECGRCQYMRYLTGDL
jgi:hypothetical protein